MKGYALPTKPARTPQLPLRTEKKNDLWEREWEWYNYGV